MNYKKEDGSLNVSKLIKHIVIGLVVLVILYGLFGTVGAGERGVRLRFGAVVGDVIGEGLYLKFPFIERIVKTDVKVQKEQVEADAASKDLQTVSSVIALNFRVNPSEVGKIYQEVGVLYKERLIDPALQEAVKAVTAKFTAEELITKREAVREEVKGLLAERLKERGVIIEEFNIVNFDFSKAFNEAIESKVTAEQNALAAKNKLEQVKFEAEQKVAEARGKAEAIRIESLALQNNPGLIELRAIEKWNGIMPQVTGGAVPFVNIK